MIKSYDMSQLVTISITSLSHMNILVDSIRLLVG